MYTLPLRYYPRKRGCRYSCTQAKCIAAPQNTGHTVTQSASENCRPGAWTAYELGCTSYRARSFWHHWSSSTLGRLRSCCCLRLGCLCTSCSFIGLFYRLFRIYSICMFLYQAIHNMLLDGSALLSFSILQCWSMISRSYEGCCKSYTTHNHL